MKSSILLTLLLMGFSSLAGEKTFFQKDHLFLEGYDPVSYFKSHRATQGSPQHKVKYKGMEVLFSSAENMKMFEASPEAYIPEYNGWCAWAMAESGDEVESDPKTFKVIEGKVYLFYNSWLADTLKKWNKAKDDKGLVSKAEKNWAK